MEEALLLLLLRMDQRIGQRIDPRKHWSELIDPRNERAAVAVAVAFAAAE